VYLECSVFKLLLLRLQQHTVRTVYPVPPSGWYPHSLSAVHGPYSVPSSSLRMIPTPSPSITRHPSVSDHSQYSPTTLILVVLLFLFHLVSTTVLSLRSCHETFWPADQPTAHSRLLTAVVLTVFGFPYVTCNSSLLRILLSFCLLSGHMSALLHSANTTPFALPLYV